ncbi:Uncharacterised protein [Streptococcus pneumoniae]|nr:Uncharacterised protein [Streptococcus pneumoniae]CJN90383.1 Uncharacterised protein [Streptococcus pneumoniae]CRH97691.1 Uncharacterised protein [Streptococcus pneumoniae]
MKPVINHCAVEVDTLNSFINGGNATLMIVWFKIETNMPRINTATTAFTFTFSTGIDICFFGTSFSCFTSSCFPVSNSTTLEISDSCFRSISFSSVSTLLTSILLTAGTCSSPIFVFFFRKRRFTRKKTIIQNSAYPAITIEDISSPPYL